jgi:amino acid transporter
MLAPIGFEKFLSYITGWFTLIGWQCGFAASAFLTGTMIQGTAVLAHSKYDALPWQGTLIVWLALLVAMLVNLAGGKLLPRLEAVILVLHVLGFFGVIIPLVYMSDHAAAHDVFLSFQNGGEFATQGLSWFVGMTSLGFTFAGGDAAVHVSVELFGSCSMVVANRLRTRWPRRSEMRRASSLRLSC